MNMRRCFQMAPMNHEMSEWRADRYELIATEQRGSRLIGHLQQNLLVIGLGDHNEVAIPQKGDRRQRLTGRVESGTADLGLRLCRQATPSISVLPMVRVPS